MHKSPAHPPQTTKPEKRWLVILWLVVGVFLVALGRDIYFYIPQFDLNLLFQARRMMAFLVFAFLISLLWLYGWRSISKGRIPYQVSLRALPDIIHRTQLWIRWPIMVGLALLPTYLLLYSQFGIGQLGIILRGSILLGCTILISFLHNPRLNFQARLHKLFIPLTIVSALYVFGRLLTWVTPYPFSLSWSEGNRIWDYSIQFGAERYIFPSDEQIDAFISPGRSLLWGLPFLFPQTTILHMRLWDALVKSLPYILFGSLLIFGRFVEKRDWREKAFFGLWAFLFLSQGPVFSNLIVAAILAVLGVRSKNLALASILVAAAGYYANISRWTWTYAPGLWAGLFALLVEPNPTIEWKNWRALTRPVVLGLSGYLGGQFFPFITNSFFNWPPSTQGLSLIINAGETTSFQQTLLWYRWLPNSTYSPGILLGLLITIGPLAFLLLYLWRRNQWRLNPLQLAASAIVLLAFFGVGLVASAKIGGGGDLHNMDMFIVGVLLLAASAWNKLMALFKSPKTPVRERSVVFALLLVAPLYLVSSGGPLQLPNQEVVDSSLAIIQSKVAEAQAQGEVLFMDQRQLLTFGYVQDVPLVDDYEKKRLMDNALSNDQEYFSQFEADLANQRFSLIVNERFFDFNTDYTGPFPEEDLSWKYWVARPLLTYYQPIITLEEVGVQLFAPRTQIEQ